MLVIINLELEHRNKCKISVMSEKNYNPFV